MPPVTNGVSTNTVMHRPPATSPPDQEAQAKRPEKDVLLLCVCAGYSRHPWRDPGPVVVTSEPGGEPIEPRVVHSSPSSEHCSHTQWCVAGTLPDHQEELSCLTAPCLAAPACSVSPHSATCCVVSCAASAPCPPHLHHNNHLRFEAAARCESCSRLPLCTHVQIASRRCGKSLKQGAPVSPSSAVSAPILLL